MIGVMIFVIENEFLVQLGFDSWDLRPSESARLFKSLRMSSPLLITKVFKLTMQVRGSLCRLSHASKRALDLVFQLSLQERKMYWQHLPAPCCLSWATKI